MLAKELRARRLEWTKGGHLGHFKFKGGQAKGNVQESSVTEERINHFLLRLFSTYSCNEFIQLYRQFSAYQRKAFLKE